MKNQNKTELNSTAEQQPADELAKLRQRIAELETLTAEQEQIEEALRTSEANYRSIFNSVNDMIFVYDVETETLIDVNVKAIEIFGRQLFFFYAWQRADGKEQLPGHGPANFTPWIAALARAKYAGYVNPFMHGDVKPQAMSQALAKSRDYLLRCDKERKVGKHGTAA